MSTANPLSNGLVFCYLRHDLKDLLHDINSAHPFSHRFIKRHYPYFSFSSDVLKLSINHAIKELTFAVNAYQEKLEKLLPGTHYSEPSRYDTKIQKRHIWRESTIPYLSQQLKVAQQLKKELEVTIPLDRRLNADELWDFFEPYFFFIK